MTDQNTIRPCPFCGEGAILEVRGLQFPSFRVECESCGVNIAWHGSDDAAVEAWNTRIGTAADGTEASAFETDLAFKLSKAAEDVFMERKRQVMVEGWVPEHDDEHDDSALSQAAACYALADNSQVYKSTIWPWSLESWKPKSRRQNLVRAGALIIAEIERIDRANQ